MRRAFTLVELLVVIGIIAVLLGILMPALSRAREAAKTVQCAAQLRQIGQALAGYTSNNRGFFPGWSGWHTLDEGGPDDEPGPAWSQMLTRDLGVGPANRLYNCPSFPEEYRINYFLGGGRWLFMQGRHFMRASEIRLSSVFVLGGDCTQPSLYPRIFGSSPQTHDDCDKDDATQEAVVFWGQEGGMNVHRGGNNVLFGDFHVELRHSFDPSSMTYHPAKMQAWSDVTP